MRAVSSQVLSQQSGLAYREHTFLVDKQALPHPGLDTESLMTILPWAVLVLVMVAASVWAVRQMRRTATLIGVAPSATGGRSGVSWGLFVLALGIRLFGLGLQPADSQELTYLLQVVFPREVVTDPWLASLLTLLAPHMVSPHPPLYRLILMLVLGDAHDLAWLRGPAALAGAATVPAVYLLGTRLFGARAGLLAGLLLAVSPFHVYFSQSITPYTLVGLWVILAYLFHDDALRPGGPWRCYTGVLALGFLTHFSVPALFAPLAVEVLWRFWRSPRADEDHARLWRFVAAGCVSLVPFSVCSVGLFFYSDMIAHIFPMIHAMALFPPVVDVASALAAFLGGAVGFFSHGFASAFATPEWSVAAILGLCLAGIGGANAAKKHRPDGRLLVGGVVLFAVFFVALGCLTIVGNGFFYFASRRFIPIVPVLVVLWAGGAAVLWARAVERGLPAWAGSLAVALFLAAPLSLQVTRLHAETTAVVRPDMRDAVVQLAPHLEDGDAIATGPYVFFDFLYSYHAPGQIKDWYQAGGVPRWTTIRAVPNAEPVDVMVSTTDIALPWEDLASHAALRRIWLLDVDEAPYGLRELEGPGTITSEALEAAGLLPCDSAPIEVSGVGVQCFRTKPAAPLQDELVIGQEDYRQVMGFAPPGVVRSYARRLAPSGTVLFGSGAPATTLRVSFMRWFGDPVEVSVTVRAGNQEQRETVTLNARKQTVELPLSMPAQALSEPLTVTFDAPEALMDASPRCFRHRRERYRRGWLDCGIFIRQVTLRRVDTQ